MTFVDSEDRKLVKEIVKQTQAKLQERVVPEATIKKWAARIEGMASDIERLVYVGLSWTPNCIRCVAGNRLSLLDAEFV